MNITKVAYTRKYNLGNYESLDISAEAQLNEKDNPLEVWTILADNTEMWFIAQQNKDKKPQPKQEQPTQTSSDPYIKIRSLFPAEIEKRLDFTVKGNEVIIKPVEFLGSELFAKILAIVKQNKGEYVSAGKESHFRMPL